MLETVDVTEMLDEPEDMALCPLCDNVILEYEPVVIAKASGCICLAHECCCV